jgi:hypothetical protein
MRVCYCLRPQLPCRTQEPLLTCTSSNFRLVNVRNLSTSAHIFAWQFSLDRQHNWHCFWPRHICSRRLERCIRLGYVVARAARQPPSTARNHVDAHTRGRLGAAENCAGSSCEFCDTIIYQVGTGKMERSLVDERSYYEELEYIVEAPNKSAT